MPAATASGADTGANGSAQRRDHNQGNQGRSYTAEQKAAVIRVRRCQHTAFYEILGVESSVSDGEIKKAYRKLSLLTHPDKNGYDGADEAFKMVSRAFQVLSDAEKKTKFDKFGGDPDNRFGPGAAASSPFSGFARSTSGARGPMFEDEISPEELFNRFFSGGMGGGMGGGFGPFGADMFGGGQQFVFNLNGGPGFRVHQFGGGRPRRRPPGASNGQDERQRSISGVLQNLLPLLILFILPLLSSIFSPGDSTPSGPEFRLSPDPPFTAERATYQLRIPFFINPQDVEDYTARMFTRLDKMVESRFLDDLQLECQGERQRRTRLVQQAQGFFFQDQAKMQEAKRLEMASCQRLASLGVPLYTY